jgi:sulfotransferase
MRKAFLGFCAGALEKYFEAITDRPVCVDKSRGWIPEYDWLVQFHPNPKILIPVRDLRAVLSSMEKRWHAQPHRRSAETATDPTGVKMATREGRVTHWLNTRPVGGSVTDILGMAERGLLSRCHIVRFEDLTTKPQKVMDGIYDYLEEPHFTHDFENVVQVTRENDAHQPVYGDHKIRSEVKPVPLDYHDTLGKTLSNTIKQHNAAFYSLLYPEA